MSKSFSEIDSLLILIHPDDPVLLDPDFISRLHYGGFVSRMPDLSEEARQTLFDEEIPEPFRGMYVFEIYTDRLSDLVLHALPSNKHFRSLIYREFLQEAEDDEDQEDPLVQMIYEIRTVGRMAAVRSDPQAFEVIDDLDPDAVDDQQTHTAPRILH